MCRLHIWACVRLGSGSSLLEESIEILHCLSPNPCYRPLDNESVEQTSKAVSGFVFDNRTEFAACANSPEVAFVVGVR